MGTCWTSKVDAIEGVSYRGYLIPDLAYLEPEHVIYLLFNKALPDEAQAATFHADLVTRAQVPESVFQSMRALPRDGHPMDWFAITIQLLGMAGKSNHYHEDGLNLVARLPIVLAALFRIREGWGAPIAPDPSLGYVENFVHMLDMPGADRERVTQLLRVFYILHLDHGGGNLSTFAGKAVASGLADMYQSMAAAMNALAGPRHGRANQDCLEFVRRVNTSDPAEVKRWVEREIAQGGLLYGFGHAVLRAEDPRAQVELELGDRICPDSHEFRIVKALRQVVPPILQQNPKVSNPYANVDLVSGSLLNAVGFTDPEYYTTFFGWARAAGIAAQIIDERMYFRNGKGVPIYRPRYLAVNQPPQSVRAGAGPGS